MPQALENISGDLFALTEETLNLGIQASRESARKRMILPLHRTQDATVQRMLNFFQPGTYVQPHYHPLKGAIETILVLRGVLGFVVFDDAGNIVSTHRLKAGGLGLVDVEPRVWHGMVALAPDTVILEIKQGPYNRETDKVFAHWAPAEDEAGFEKVIRKIEDAF